MGLSCLLLPFDFFTTPFLASCWPTSSSLSRFSGCIVFHSLLLSGLFAPGTGSSLPFCCTLGPLFASSHVLVPSNLPLFSDDGSVTVLVLRWAGFSLCCCDGPTVPCPPFAAPSLRSSWLCLFFHGSGIPFCVGLIPRLLAKVRLSRGLELTLVAPFWP